MKALLLAVGLLIVGAALAIGTWLLAPAPFARGWLAALFALLGWPLGSMALLLIHALTGGRWGEAIRLPLLLGTLLLPARRSSPRSPSTCSCRRSIPGRTPTSRTASTTAGISTPRSSSAVPPPTP